MARVALYSTTSGEETLHLQRLHRWLCGDAVSTGWVMQRMDWTGQCDLVGVAVA